ncbi:MAG: AGE family epimerase/isomerase [Lachnospiraceae bacterium]|nr:AGE family epimerase/isomerase [Lachnospiraceae bacterium]
MKKYQYGTEENRKFLKDLGEELLSFGHQFPSEGGSSYYLGDDGSPDKDSPRFTFMTCRMCHVYCLGHFLGHEGSDELIDAAIKGLKGELYDSRNDGWIPGLEPDGTPLEDKQCYAHAFVILAACSALKAGRPGARELLDHALQVYDKYFWDEKEGLASDTWNSDFTVQDTYRGINSNMHSVEAFLAVADVCGNEEYRKRAGSIIKHVVKWAEDNDWRIPEHFNDKWEVLLEYNADRKDDRFKPYGATPGHGIEWARLTTQWAISTFGKDSEESRKYISAACKLYERAIGDGWNKDGAPGIVYTTMWDGTPVVHDRMHWTLAEAINTSAVLYNASGNKAYLKDYEEFMDYLDNYVHDKKYGSWYHQMDRNNKVIGTVWPGKSDLYHAMQAMLIPYRDISKSIICSVSEGDRND